LPFRQPSHSRWQSVPFSPFSPLLIERSAPFFPPSPFFSSFPIAPVRLELCAFYTCKPHDSLKRHEFGQPLPFSPKYRGVIAFSSLLSPPTRQNRRGPNSVGNQGSCSPLLSTKHPEPFPFFFFPCLRANHTLHTIIGSHHLSFFCFWGRVHHFLSPFPFFFRWGAEHVHSTGPSVQQKSLNRSFDFFFFFFWCISTDKGAPLPPPFFLFPPLVKD